MKIYICSMISYFPFHFSENRNGPEKSYFGNRSGLFSQNVVVPHFRNDKLSLHLDGNLTFWMLLDCFALSEYYSRLWYQV